MKNNNNRIGDYVILLSSIQYLFALLQYGIYSRPQC